MNPKSGTAGSPVTPATPAEVVESDTADPGEIVPGRTAESDSSSPAKAHKPDPEATSWIEIELVDEQDQPVSGERYEVEVPGGAVSRGSLDQNGYARIEGIEAGTCKISFPELDQDAWETA